jgi:hypothetical protein
MQPYFDTTIKTTTNKNGRRPQEKGGGEMEDDLNKNVNGRQPQPKIKMEGDLNIFFLNLNDDLKKFGDDHKKKEDNLK